MAIRLDVFLSSGVNMANANLPAKFFLDRHPTLHLLIIAGSMMYGGSFSYYNLESLEQQIWKELMVDSEMMYLLNGMVDEWEKVTLEVYLL